MIKPQETAQYGQVLRVSVVREILNARISASARETSKPRAMVPPIVVALKNPRRVSSIRSSFAGAGGRLGVSRRIPELRVRLVKRIARSREKIVLSLIR